jgi:hypothetical protein
MRPEAQATFAYEYHRYAKDSQVAFMLTLFLGIVGGECYYLGNYMRGVLMSLALFTGIGLFVTVPMWICRCFTVQNECDIYNDFLAYSLALRYWPREPVAGAYEAAPPSPPQAPQPPPTSRVRPNIGGVPMHVRTV